MLQVEVSVMGTGSLNMLCKVWPPASKVEAIPVQAAVKICRGNGNVHVKCKKTE